MNKVKAILLTTVVGIAAFAGVYATAYAASYFITQQGGTGTTSPSGILYGDNGATNHINSVLVGSGLTFSGGTLSATGGGTGTVTQVNTTYPVLGGPITTTGTLSLAFGTTTSNLWAGVQTFTNSPIFSTLTGGTVNSTSGGAIYNTATSTPTVNAPITYSGTLGQFIGGVSGAFDCVAATGSVKGCLTAADWTTFNNKQTAGNYITALTGDITASGPGSSAATLATVNSNVGSFTSANITVNAKGLITAASNGSGGGGASTDKWATSTDATSIYPNSATAVGIGLTNPGSTLELKATTTTSGANTFIAWDSANRDMFRIRNDGHIGLASSTPWAQLSVNPIAANGTAPEFAVGSSSETDLEVDSSGKVILAGANPILQIGASLPIYGYLANDRLNITDNRNDYSADNSYNSNAGICATADKTVANDLTSGAGQNFGDLGHTSSNFTGSGCANNPFTGFSPDSTYLIDPTGNMHFSIGSTSPTSNFSWFTGGQSASNEVARLTNLGLLGIGTSTPWGKLSVNPKATDNSTPSFVVGSSTATRMIITNAGLVGIGTSSPTSNFTLSVTGSGYFSGTERVDGATTLAGTLAVTGGTTLNNPLTYGGVTLNNAVTGTGNMVLSAAPTLSGTMTYSTAQGNTLQASLGVRAGTSAATIINIFGSSSATPVDTGGVALKYGNAGGSTALFVTGLSGFIGMGTTTPWAGVSINPLATNTTFPEFVVGSSSATSLIVSNSGNVGVGTTSPYTNLSVTGGLAVTAPAAFATGDSAVCWRATGTITVDSGISSCIVSSQFVKHDIKSIDSTSALARIMKLNPVSFTYNDTGRNDMGLIAEKVSIVDPTYAQYTATDKVLDGHKFKAGDPTAINWASITADLIKSVQSIVLHQSDQDKRIAALEARVQALQSNNQVLSCKVF